MSERKDKPGTSVAALPRGAGGLSRPDREMPLSASLAAVTRSYRAQARADNTIGAYRDAWRRFTAWCER